MLGVKNGGLGVRWEYSYFAVEGQASWDTVKPGAFLGASYVLSLQMKRTGCYDIGGYYPMHSLYESPKGYKPHYKRCKSVQFKSSSLYNQPGDDEDMPLLDNLTEYLWSKPRNTENKEDSISISCDKYQKPNPLLIPLSQGMPITQACSTHETTSQSTSEKTEVVKDPRNEQTQSLIENTISPIIPTLSSDESKASCDSFNTELKLKETIVEVDNTDDEEQFYTPTLYAEGLVTPKKQVAFDESQTCTPTFSDTKDKLSSTDQVMTLSKKLQTVISDNDSNAMSPTSVSTTQPLSVVKHKVNFSELFLDKRAESSRNILPQDDKVD